MYENYILVGVIWTAIVFAMPKPRTAFRRGWPAAIAGTVFMILTWPGGMAFVLYGIWQSFRK